MDYFFTNSVGDNAIFQENVIVSVTLSRFRVVHSCSSQISIMTIFIMNMIDSWPVSKGSFRGWW